MCSYLFQNLVTFFANSVHPDQLASDDLGQQCFLLNDEYLFYKKSVNSDPIINGLLANFIYG